MLSSLCLFVDSLTDSSVKLPDTLPRIDNVNYQKEINGRSDSICTNGSIRSDDDDDDEYFLDTIEVFFPQLSA